MFDLRRHLRDVPPLSTAVAVLVSAAMLSLLGTWVPPTDELGAAEPNLPHLGEVPQVEVDHAGVRHVAVPARKGLAEVLRITPGIVSATEVGEHIAVSTTLEYATIATLVGAQPTPEPDVHLSSLESEPYSDWQWPLHNTGQTVQGSAGKADADVDALASFRAGRLGAGVVVAVVDTGFDSTHPELTAATWRNSDEVCANSVDDDANGYVDDCYGWDFANNDNSPSDPTNHYHGTHVASTIAAAHNNSGMAGLAPGASIMNVKLSNGSSFSASAAALGIRYAVDNGANIVNASFGSAGPSTVMASAVAYAASRGVLVVAAAGNSATNNDVVAPYPASIPESNVIAVASTDSNDRLAASSGYGATSVDLAGPGVNVLGAYTGGTYAYASGTSMAAPHVAAAAALVMASGILAPAQVRSILINSVDSLPGLSGKMVSGGRLNVAKALSLSDPDNSPATPTSAVAGPSPVEAAVTFTGFTGLTSTAPLSGTVSYAPPTDSAATPGPYRLEGQLVSLDPSPAVIQQHPVRSSGVLVATDDSGAWDLVASKAAGAYTARSDIPVEVALPSGRYALVVSAVSALDPLVVFGGQHAVLFEVGASGTPNPTLAPVTSAATTTTTIPPTGGTGTGGTGTGGTGTGGTAPSSGSGGAGAGSGGSGSGGSSGSGSGGAGAGSGGSGSGSPSGSGSGGSSGAGSGGGSPTSTSTPRNGGGTTPPPPTPPAGGSTAGPGITAPPGVPVSSGPWSMSAISPNRCQVRTACRVIIAGTFPRAPHVWLGNTVIAASSVTRTPTALSFLLPSNVAAAGVVDVSLRDFGVNLTMARGFTFFAPTNSGTPTTTRPTTTRPTTTRPTTTRPTTTRPTTTRPTTTRPTTSRPPITSASTTAPRPTTTLPPGASRRAALGVGSSLSRSGLRVAPITSGSPLARLQASTGVCRAASCPGVRL